MGTNYTDRSWTSSDGLNLHFRDYYGPEGSNGPPVLCMHGLTRNSRDFADLAKPPNLGVLSLRFPVRKLDVLAATLEENGFASTARGNARLPPYGMTQVLVVRGPNGEWLEFYEEN